MSWFDTSGFSSFAKTAFSQAQNLQKSIDRVLDIKDETSGAAPSSSASSKQKSDFSSVSTGSGRESLTTRKSSSSLSTTVPSKSPRKSSLVDTDSKDIDSNESNSFWSSFLGDSFSSSTTNNDSKTSNCRTAGRKPGSRVSGTAAGRKVRSKYDIKEAVNTARDKDSISSAKPLKHDKNDGVDITNSTKAESNLLVVSSVNLSQQQETGDFAKDLHNKVEKKICSDVTEVGEGNLQKGSCDAQNNSVTPVERSKGLELKHSITTPTELSQRDNNEELNTPGNDSASLLNISEEASSKDLQNEEPIAANEEPVSVVEVQNQTRDTRAVNSSVLEQPEGSRDTNAITLERIVNTDGIIHSQNAEEVSTRAVSSSVSLGLDTSPVMDSTVSYTVVTDKAELSFPTESTDQHRFHKGEPLASSTPNTFLDKESNKETKIEEASSPEPSEDSDVLNQSEGLVNISFTGIKENEPLFVNETELIKDVVFVEERKQFEDSIPQQQKEEMPCKEVETQHLSMNNESAVIPENTGENERDLVENDAHSVESTEDLKSKIKELQNEVTDLQHVVEVRENKLVELSKENVDLQETATILRSQLKQAEAALKADDEEVEEVRQEFTIRVAATENKFQAAAKERDKLKALLEQTEKNLNSKNDRQSEEFTTLLKEKDDQIAQLLEEGERLSKQELQINNTIKKLRAKEKENEALMKKNSKTIEELTSENARLTEILRVKEDTEKKQADAITKLNAYVEKQEEKVAKLNSELDDANERLRSMQTALDNAYKQLADLHKENASKDSAVQEAALSAEMNAKEGLRVTMEKRERQFKKELETLEFQISDLQSSVQRGEQQASRREDNLRQEISDLQQRLQEAEARNQELTESVTHATRPLLRQIENLQSSYGNHTQTWERVERNLTERLNEAQIQLAEAQERERVATEHALELKSRVAAVESQLITYRQDKSRLEATLEVERTKLDTAEDARSREAARAEAMEIKYRKMMEDNNVEKALLEQQLAVEKSKMETEKKRFQSAMNEKERILLQQSSLSGVPPSPSASSELSQDELPEASPHRTHVRQSSSGSFIDGISRGIMGGSTAMVERLQAQVKQKDGEIELLQEEITSLQKTRDSLTEELTILTSRVENLELDSRLLAELRTRHKELEQRHNAVLQMYGEKAEQCEELKMDLEDVKSMYKSQIQELLGATR